MISQLVILAICAALTSAHPPPRECFFDPDIAECCKFPKETNEAEIQTILNKCDQRYPMKQGHKCALECFLNETKVLKDGKIDQKAAIALDAFLPEDKAEWAPLAEAAVSKCAGWSEDEKYQSSEESQECTHKAAFFINCVMGQLFGSCPEKAWKADEKCEAARTAVGKCRVFIVKHERHM